VELAWRLGCTGLLALSALISGYHYRKAGPMAPVVYGAREGLALAAIRLTWVSVAVALPILYALEPRWLAWAALPLPPVLRASLGAALGASHAALLAWAHRALGANFSSSLRTRAHHELVTTGPYRWVRHPLYGAALLLYSALGVLSANWAVGLGGLSFMLFIIVVRTPREERMLHDAFGPSYARYHRRTGGLLPRIPERRGDR